MKYLFFFILFALNLQVQAQDFVSNFRLSNRKALYEHVFLNEEISDLKESLKKQLLTTGGITNVQDNGQYLTAEINEMIIDYRKYGATYFEISFPLTKPIRGKLMIEFRDGRYKAHISDIVFIDNDYRKGINDFSLEEAFVRNNRQEFRSRSSIQHSLHLMNLHFMEIFTLNAEEEIPEDW